MHSSSHIFGPNQFISIVITSFSRPFYLKQCLESIKEYADMPCEIIVNDDGSSMEDQLEILKQFRNIASTIILNTGKNMGLNISANRAVAVSNSKYILFMNDDCFFLSSGLKKICKALEDESIGWISPTNSIPHLNNINASVVKTNDLGGGHCIAFRKEAWNSVGGWSENNTTGQSDNVFLLKLLSSGLFKGYIPNNNFISYIHPHTPGYVESYQFTKGNDCSYPKLLKITSEFQFNLDNLRREYCQYWVDGQRVILDRTDGRANPINGLNDFAYWGSYIKNVVNDNGTVNWENGIVHGHDKWRNK